jgi:cobalt-zinc-cadmium efflux system outer membrane protein
MKALIWFNGCVLILLAGGSAVAAFAQAPARRDLPGVVISESHKLNAEADRPAPLYTQFIDAKSGLNADDLVRYALDHNGELLAARQIVAEARGRLRQAGLRPNPMIEGNGQRALTSPDNNLTIGVELPLELGGRRSARVTVAEREIGLREAEVADFARKLAAEVRLRYVEATAAARNLKVSEDLLALTRESHSLVRARVEAGRSAPLDQNVLLVEVNRVNAMVVGDQSKTETALFDLKKSIGMPPEQSLLLQGDSTPGAEPPPIADAVRQALASRPDLLAARDAEKLAQAQIEQARTEGKMDASIFANYQRMNFGYDIRGFNQAGQLTPVTGIFHYATFGLKLTLPVRNKNQGNIDVALASAEEARNRREFAEIVIRNEVAAAYARTERARAALILYGNGVRDQALHNLDIIRQTYSLGRKSMLDYLSEQRRYIDIETGYTDLLKKLQVSLIEIDRAIAAPLPKR